MKSFTSNYCPASVETISKKCFVTILDVSKVSEKIALNADTLYCRWRRETSAFQLPLKKPKAQRIVLVQKNMNKSQSMVMATIARVTQRQVVREAQKEQ